MSAPVHVVDPRWGSLVGLKLLGGPASLFAYDEKRFLSRLDFEIRDISVGPFGAKVRFRLHGPTEDELESRVAGMHMDAPKPVFGMKFAPDGNVRRIIIGHQAEGRFHWMPYRGILVPTHWLARGIPASLALHRIFGDDERLWPPAGRAA